jgi:hypothetical protein
MRENAKKTLLTMAYYGMIILMVALIISLFIGVTNNGIALWVRVCAIVISVLLVLVVLYTTLCMYSDMSAYTAGYALCILTVATVIVSFIFYARLTPVAEIIATANLNVFLFVVGNLVIINLLTIAIFITGLYIKQPKEIGHKAQAQKN